MKLWNWLKSLSLIATIGAVVTGAFFALAGVRASRHKKAAEDMEQQAENLLLSRTKKDIEKAADLRDQADKKKAEAAAIRDNAAKHLDDMGAKDETLADIADRFNKRRVRRDSGGAS